MVALGTPGAAGKVAAWLVNGSLSLRFGKWIVRSLRRSCRPAALKDRPAEFTAKLPSDWNLGRRFKVEERHLWPTCIRRHLQASRAFVGKRKTPAYWARPPQFFRLVKSFFLSTLPPVAVTSYMKSLRDWIWGPSCFHLGFFSLGGRKPSAESLPYENGATHGSRPDGQNIIGRPQVRSANSTWCVRARGWYV